MWCDDEDVIRPFEVKTFVTDVLRTKYLRRK